MHNKPVRNPISDDREYQAWVASFVRNLKKHFNLQSWTIEIVFSDEPDEKGAYADNDINSQYLFSTITFYPPAKRDFNNRQFELLIMSVVHEIVHVFLDPLSDAMHDFLSITTAPMFMRTLETQTQTLTMVFLKTLPKSLIPPRPKKNGKHNNAPADDKPRPAVHS